MHASQLIVTRMPLGNLWDSEGQLEAHRVRRVGKDEISELMRNGSTFVVADVGQPLCWIPEQDRFMFWKAEVQGRLVPPERIAFVTKPTRTGTAMSPQCGAVLAPSRSSSWRSTTDCRQWLY